MSSASTAWDGVRARVHALPGDARAVFAVAVADRLAFRPLDVDSAHGEVQAEPAWRLTVLGLLEEAGPSPEIIRLLGT